MIGTANNVIFTQEESEQTSVGGIILPDNKNSTLIGVVEYAPYEVSIDGALMDTDLSAGDRFLYFAPDAIEVSYRGKKRKIINFRNIATILEEKDDE